MTIEMMLQELKSMGLKRTYKPYCEHESQTILLETRRHPRPAKITDGIMRGCEIDVYDDHTIRVWTHRKKLANKIAQSARSSGCKIRLLDGEAELYLPVLGGERFLHALGARVRVALSPEAGAKRAVALRAYRDNRKRPEPVAA